VKADVRRSIYAVCQVKGEVAVVHIFRKGVIPVPESDEKPLPDPACEVVLVKTIAPGIGLVGSEAAEGIHFATEFLEIHFFFYANIRKNRNEVKCFLWLNRDAGASRRCGMLDEATRCVAGIRES